MTEPSYMTAEGREALQAELEKLETRGPPPDRRADQDRARVGRSEGERRVPRGQGRPGPPGDEDPAAARAAPELPDRRRAHGRRRSGGLRVDGRGGGRGGWPQGVYTLVSQHEASPSEGRLAFDSPVGAALRDKRVGEVAVVATPRGERRLKVVSIAWGRERRRSPPIGSISATFGVRLGVEAALRGAGERRAASSRAR